MLNARYLSESVGRVGPLLAIEGSRSRVHQGVALVEPVTLAKLSTVTLNSLGTQIIAGATTGGLRRSVDSGANWSQMTRITL